MGRILAFNALLLATTMDMAALAQGRAAIGADGLAQMPMVAVTPVHEADQSSTPLTLEEVLRASARSAPDIIAALARMRQAEGRALSAEGAATDAAVKLIEARARIAAARASPPRARSSLLQRPMKTPSSWTRARRQIQCGAAERGKLTTCAYPLGCGLAL